MYHHAWSPYILFYEFIFAFLSPPLSAGLAASPNSHRAILLTPFWYWVQSTAIGNWCEGGWKTQNLVWLSGKHIPSQT